MRTARAPFLLGVALLTGCLSWESSFPELPAQPAGSATGTAAALAEADRLAARAGDRPALEGAIAAYAAVLEQDPASFPALTRLGQLTVLLGAAYGKDSAEKAALYQQAGNYSAAALYTNPAFRRRIEAGATLADASGVLGERELDPMGFWCQAVFYFFKEGLGPVGQVRNFRWIQEAQAVLARMEEIDPDWKRGGIPFSQAIVYLALPEAAGGDDALAQELIDRAVERHPGMIRNRWGRAKYFHTASGDADALREDLRWVLAQDPQRGGPYPWNVYFQADARRTLARLE